MTMVELLPIGVQRFESRIDAVYTITLGLIALILSVFAKKYPYPLVETMIANPITGINQCSI